jgi:hypothetical protein
MSPRKASESGEDEVPVGPALKAFREFVSSLVPAGVLDALLEKITRSEKPAEPLASPEDVFLTAEELSERWRLNEQTLANQRAAGEGIPYTKLPSGSIRYRFSDVLEAERDGRHGFTWASRSRAAPGFGPTSAWSCFITSNGR